MLNRSVKTLFTTSVIMLATMAFSHQAVATDRYEARGRVLKVTPQYERVNLPRQECRTEYRTEVQTPRRSMAGTVIGGIAGGLLGSQIGKGNGKVAAAAIGAGIGAITGDRMSRNQRHVATSRQVPVDVCYSVDNWQNQKTGYLVDYEYQGREYSIVTDSHPGRFINLDVTVTPVITSNARSHTNQYQPDIAWRDVPHRHKAKFRNRY